MSIKFSGREGAGGCTIGRDRWNICNKGSKMFCMCRRRAAYSDEDAWKSQPHRIRSSTIKAIEKAYKEGTLDDPFALVTGGTFCQEPRLILRRKFK